MKQHSIAMDVWIDINITIGHHWILIGINKYFISIVGLFMFEWEYVMMKCRTLFFWIYRLRCKFLQNHLSEYLVNIPLNIRQECWFQQDGASARFHHDVRIFLDKQYPNHWIGRGGPIPWPPRSSDLNSLDFFFFLFKKYYLRECTDHQMTWYMIIE